MATDGHRGNRVLLSKALDAIEREEPHNGHGLSLKDGLASIPGTPAPSSPETRYPQLEHGLSRCEEPRLKPLHRQGHQDHASHRISLCAPVLYTWAEGVCLLGSSLCAFLTTARKQGYVSLWRWRDKFSISPCASATRPPLQAESILPESSLSETSCEQARVRNQIQLRFKLAEKTTAATWLLTHSPPPSSPGVHTGGRTINGMWLLCPTNCSKLSGWYHLRRLQIGKGTLTKCHSKIVESTPVLYSWNEDKLVSIVSDTVQLDVLYLPRVFVQIAMFLACGKALCRAPPPPQQEEES